MPNGTSTDQNASLSKGQFLALGVAATIAVGGLLYAYKNYTPRYPSNLNRVLDYYGFKTPEQKEALRFLMQQSGVKETDALLDGTAENQTALSRSILAFVSETQNKFTIRTGKQERWEVQTPDWIKDPALQKQILSALEILNMMDAVPPKFERRDAVCILGATRSTMVSRLSYAADLFLSNKLPANWLIMLSGERYVTPDHGGNRVDG
ncbi:MAG TPA: hypothetical protein VLG38_07725, partial [Gammaproteobacteria bacterium]|nr:hypothetical protein [Gammaproteobacteria bacterium]